MVIGQITTQSASTLDVSLARDNPKNYLLVPLSRDGDRYRLDFDMVDQVTNRARWESLTTFTTDMPGTYHEVTAALSDRILFQVNTPQKLFHVEELLPSTVKSVRKHSFKEDFDLSACLLAKVFGRKKPAKDGTSLQDWLYLYPTKLALVREIRD